MNHTPEHWVCDARIGCVAVYPEGEQHNCLSGADEWAIYYKHGKWGPDENEEYRWTIDPITVANAKLIAAAPELLEACQMAVTTIDAREDSRFGDLETSLIRLRISLSRAIAKATKEAVNAH